MTEREQEGHSYSQPQHFMRRIAIMWPCAIGDTAPELLDDPHWVRYRRIAHERLIRGHLSEITTRLKAIGFEVDSAESAILLAGDGD